jgi:hypothetical protein
MGSLLGYSPIRVLVAVQCMDVALFLAGCYRHAPKEKSPGSSLSFQYFWGGKGHQMPNQLVVVVPSIVGYVPPSGFRIVSIREQEDGSYEVTLEPMALPS